MNFSRELKNLFVGFMMGLSQADREILLNSGSEIPQEVMVSVKKKTNRNLDFLNSIQAGQLSEQQLKWFYAILDGMDDFHRNGRGLQASGISQLLSEQTKFKKVDDYEPGFTHLMTFTNRMIDNSIGKGQIPTLSILRDNPSMGIIKIEDYCNEIVIKKGSDRLLAEFYCSDFRNDGSNLKEKVFDRLYGYNLANFIDIQAFNAVKSTATRNGIDHAYRVINYYDIKKLSKGFVVKFLVEEL